MGKFFFWFPLLQFIFCGVSFLLLLHLYKNLGGGLFTFFDGDVDTEVQVNTNFTPEYIYSMTWMRRTRLYPVQNWFNPDDMTAPFHELNETAAREGNIVMPLHAFYLFMYDYIVSFGNNTQDFWSDYAPGVVPVTDLEVGKYYAPLLLSLCVSFLGPTLWKFCLLFSSLVMRAAASRETLLEDKQQLLTKLSDEKKEWHMKLVACGTFTVLFVSCLIPLFLLELSSFYPITISVSFILIGLLCVFSFESEMIEPAYRREDYLTEKPLVKKNKLIFYSLKKNPSIKSLCFAAVLFSLPMLLQVQFLILLPVLLFWIAIQCNRKGNKRVLVEMISDEKKEGENRVHVGFSSHKNYVSIYGDMCMVTAAVVCSLFVSTRCFWYGRETWIAFVKHFTLRPILKPDQSFTGGKEASSSCYYYLESGACARATPNVWFIAEYFQISITKAIQELARLVDFNSPEKLFLLFSLFFVSIFNVLPCLLTFLYRSKSFPLNFDSPKDFAEACAEQQKKYEAYWAEKKASGKKEDKKQSTNDGANSKDAEIARGVTRLCKEEYILKQASLLGWLLIISSTSAALFLPFTSPLTVVAIYPGALIVLCIKVSATLERFSFPSTFNKKIEIKNDEAAELSANIKNSSWCKSFPSNFVVSTDLTDVLLLFGCIWTTSAGLTFVFLPEYIRMTISCVLMAFACLSLRTYGMELIACAASGGIVFISRQASFEREVPPVVEQEILSSAIAAFIFMLIMIRGVKRIFDISTESDEVRFVPIKEQVGIFS